MLVPGADLNEVTFWGGRLSSGVIAPAPDVSVVEDCTAVNSPGRNVHDPVVDDIVHLAACPTAIKRAVSVWTLSPADDPTALVEPTAVECTGCDRRFHRNWWSWVATDLRSH